MKLTHPCKDTCSGYSQDCAQQVEALESRVRELEAELKYKEELCGDHCAIETATYAENKSLRKVVAAARNFDYELKPDEYRRGTSVWIDGDEMKELNLALEELDRAERGGG